MRIGRIILRVGELDESISFWERRVGLEVTGRGGSFAFLDGGGVQLVLNQVDDVPADDSLTEIVLEVDDVTSEHREMKARGVPFEVDLRPVTGDGSQELWASHFRDPDGHLASLTGWISV